MASKTDVLFKELRFHVKQFKTAQLMDRLRLAEVLASISLEILEGLDARLSEIETRLGAPINPARRRP